MKHRLLRIFRVLLGLMLISMDVVPASQASAAPNSAAYPAAQAKGMQADRQPGCPIDWSPSALLPVWGSRKSFDENSGAPGALQVFYPTLGPYYDMPPGSIASGCGPYPLVILLHGNCEGDTEVYKHWIELPETLARSGYVVVVPKMPGIANGYVFQDSDIAHAKAVIDWMYNGWEYHDQLTRSPAPAVIGHSFGALLGTRLVPEIGASAFVSLSAGWHSFGYTAPQDLGSLNAPSLFVWGDGPGDSEAPLDNTQWWPLIKLPKHKLVLKGADHWDYLFPFDLPCRDSERGPCRIVPGLVADYTALFLSRYAPPPNAGIEGLITPSLTLPSVARTPLHEGFAVGHLESLKNLSEQESSCKVDHSVENATPSWFDPSLDWVDRSAEYGTPAAESKPTVAVIPGLGAHHIAYRDTSDRLQELWRDATGATGTTNLTSEANAPKADGNPFAYVDTLRNIAILLYRDNNGVVRSLHWSTGAVGHDNLSGTAGAPNAASDPVGYYDAASDTHHVIYRSSNGHLHELWSQGVEPIKYGGDLTVLAGAPTAVGQPAAFVGSNGTNIVVYRASDNHIRSLYWTTGAVSHENLSGFAGSPLAAGDPVAYYTAHNDTPQIVYKGNDGRLWELISPGNAPVIGWNIMSHLNVPAVSGTPTIFYSAATNTKHVIYRSGGQLHEIRWNVASGVQVHINLGVAYNAPPATGDPAGFAVEASGSRHVTYRGTNNHIYEVILR